MLKENYQSVKKKIPPDVILVAVSKTHSVSEIMEVYEEGQRDFGENKVQELNDKYDQLPQDIRWHMIGHLQTNKVKYLIEKVSMIHSVDSVHLAETIDREAAKHDVVMPILIEVNIAEEESKSGISPLELPDLILSVSRLSHIQVKGLMCVPPIADNPDDNRKYFKALKNLSIDISSRNIDNISMDVLSMGMSDDYETAISEGANIVRVGTGIFGPRDYTRL